MNEPSFLQHIIARIRAAFRTHKTEMLVSAVLGFLVGAALS